MAIKEEKILIKPKGATIKHYERLGYQIPRKENKFGKLVIDCDKMIEVKVNDLPVGSTQKVTKICDVCNKIVGERSYYDVLNTRNNGMDLCVSCSRKQLFKVDLDKCVANVDRDFAKCFLYEEDTYLYTCQSNKYAEFICKTCNYHIGKKLISNVYRFGTHCPKCSENISYPEKFMFSVLEQLNVEFITQKRFNWLKEREYDFYIPSYNCIVETHGLQHYKKTTGNFWGKELQEEIDNDLYKREMAKLNGIDFYIEIDCSLSGFEFISESIKRSKLNEIFDLSKINWVKCQEDACNKMIRKACNLWNEGVRNTSEIGRILKLSDTTIREYLKIGKHVNWCDYTPGYRIEKMKKSVVQISKGGFVVNEYNSITEASEKTGVCSTGISKCCKKEGYYAGDYIWVWKEDANVCIRELAFSINVAHQKSLTDRLNKVSKKVVQLTIKGDFIDEYESVASAALNSNVNSTSISHACKGKLKTAGGYRWKYKSDFSS